MAIRLKLKDNVEVHTLEELRDNFDREKIFDAFKIMTTRRRLLPTSTLTTTTHLKKSARLLTLNLPTACAKRQLPLPQ